MKIPTNFKQIVFNRSSDIDFRGYMNLCDKCTTKPYSFLVTHATQITLYVLEKRFKMKNCNTILTEKQQKY